MGVSGLFLVTLVPGVSTNNNQDPGGLLVGVSGVEPDSPASALLKPGDIITNVNDWEVHYHHDHHVHDHNYVQNHHIHDHHHLYDHHHIYDHPHVNDRHLKRLADLVSPKWQPVYSGQQATLSL